MSLSATEIAHSPSAQMRDAAKLDDIAHRQFDMGRRILLQKRHHPGALLGADPGEVTLAQPHSSHAWLAKPREQVEQGRLAGSVEADNHRHHLRPNVHTDP